MGKSGAKATRAAGRCSLWSCRRQWRQARPPRREHDWPNCDLIDGEKLMERRTFLVGSAMALPMLGANEKINVAVVGVGGRGTAHVREYLSIPEARVAAVCDVNTAQTERAGQLVN